MADERQVISEARRRIEQSRIVLAQASEAIIATQSLIGAARALLRKPVPAK